jgi:streptomycin 6-kinase
LHNNALFKISPKYIAFCKNMFYSVNVVLCYWKETMERTIPARLRETCGDHPRNNAWLARIPQLFDTYAQRWKITIGEPMDTPEGSMSWVGVVQQADGTPAVLKLCLPHFEGLHEARGLETWRNSGCAQLLAADEQDFALLIEYCQPGQSLRTQSEDEQDVVIAHMLKRLWQTPYDASQFRTLESMLQKWDTGCREHQAVWPDAGLVEAGLALFAELPKPQPSDRLLATDLHAGNIISAQREPWLVIDPKPFVGDRAYDGTQHLMNTPKRLLQQPVATIQRFAELLDVDAERLRLWLFARYAVESSTPGADEHLAIARILDQVSCR